MSPERYRLLMERFDAACDLDPAARGALLARLAAADPDLAAQLADLLRQDGRQGGTLGGGSAEIAGFALAAFAEAAASDTPGPTAARGAVALAAGSVLGGYRLLRVLGRGGMATVYEAVQRKIGRRVAIKVLHARIARDPHLAQRFVNEARAVNLIRHPGLVEIYEHGLLEDGTSFLVMEHLDGEPLDHRLDRRGGVTIDEATAIASQTALALAAAHERGVIHRDLKPGNVIMARDRDDPERERVKVLDFGIAHLAVAFDEEEAEAAPIHRTRSDVIMGTPGYMSPEQCRGAGGVTDRTDVYSLGVMLYELLAGQRPFLAELASEVMTLHVKAPPPALDERAPAAPPGLRRLVERMLAKDPAARPSMEEVAAALRELPSVAAVGIDARATDDRASRAPSPPGWLGRRLGSLWSRAALVGTTLLGAALATWHLSPGRPAMVLIPGGSFEMGSTPEEIDAAYHYCLGSDDKQECRVDIFEREQPRRTVRLSPYRLDATEVTNEAFAQWLNAQAGLRAAFDEEKKERWVYAGDEPVANLYPSYPIHGLELVEGRYRAVAGAAKRPVSQVTWLGASRYCATRGARLPTEAEWEYAARPRPGDRFPWGTAAPRCDGLVYGRQPGQECANHALGPAAVATMKMDRSPFGVFDLAGNVAEWVQDRFLERYPDCGPTCLDPLASEPASPRAPGVLRVFRGGDWAQLAPICRAAGRGRFRQEIALKNVGFRCAATAR